MKNFLWLAREIMFWLMVIITLPFVFLITWWALKQDDKDEK